MSRDQKPYIYIPLMLTLIVLIDQVSNLDEHLYLLLGISRLQILGQERLRLPIQKHTNLI